MITMAQLRSVVYANTVETGDNSLLRTVFFVPGGKPLNFF